MESEDIILRQTTNYQLCQWDSEDFIRRTDFNADNSKIDAALLAQTEALAAEAQTREQENLRVTLLASTAGADFQGLNMDVQRFDFSPYLWVEVVVDAKAGCSEMFMRPDGYNSFQACQLGGTPYTADSVAYGVPDASGTGGIRVKMWSYPGSDRTHFLSARMNEEEFTVLHAIHLKPLNEIKELNIWAAEENGIPRGSYIRIYGVKR